MSGTADDRAERAGTTEETASEGSKAPEATPALPGRSGGGHAHQLDRAVLGSIRSIARDASENLRWLHDNVPDVFLSTMREDTDAITELVTDLRRLRHDRQLILADREDELTVALLDVPGSIFQILQRIQDKEILRVRKRAEGQFVFAAGKAVTDDETIDAMKRQVNNCQLAKNVRASIE